ncbi:MAG: hypothetical protein KC933_20370 [Myxococcales bacterium]|nr:hypothetical protein [Myxococcales bacterium]
MRLSRLSLVIFAALPAFACGSEVELEEAELAEDVATTTSAIKNVDPCAMGSTANASGRLFSVGDFESYQRSAAWINGICPAIGKDRKTTMVDFYAAQNTGNHWFKLIPTFEPVSNAVECASLLAAMRVMFRQVPTGEFIEQQYIERRGVWDPPGSLFDGVCTPPTISAFSDSGWETFRVRAVAYNADGTFATVRINGSKY